MEKKDQGQRKGESEVGRIENWRLGLSGIVFSEGIMKAKGRLTFEACLLI